MTRPDEQDVAALVDYLAHRDVECPLCRYNLRALRSGRCPECNNALALHVGLFDPLGASYILTLIGLALGAGAFFLLLLATGVFSLTEGPPPRSEAVAMIVYPLIAMAVLGTCLIRVASRGGRKRFTRRPPKLRRTVAFLAWVLSLASFTGWIAVLYLQV